MTKPGPVKEDRYEVEKLLEYITQPGADIPQSLVKWSGWRNTQSTWEKADQIDDSLKREFWLNGSKKATYRKRQVGSKAMDKRKTRKETIEMINKERTKVLQTPVTTSSRNMLNMEDEYLQYLEDTISQIPYPTPKTLYT